MPAVPLTLALSAVLAARVTCHDRPELLAALGRRRPGQAADPGSDSASTRS